MNSTSWRNRIILSIDCYITKGYFSQKLMRQKYKNRQTILQKWDVTFSDIVTLYPFSTDGYTEFCKDFVEKIALQSTYHKLSSLI